MFLSSRLAILFLCLPIALSNASTLRKKPHTNSREKSEVQASGCTKSLPSSVTIGETSNVTLTSNDIERSYLINIPQSYTNETSVPLILSFHGGTKNATNQLELDLFTEPKFNALNAIVVYPQGINDVWQGVPGVTTNDTLFVSDILDSLNQDYCIDTTRVFATGKSDGAGFTNVLACDSVLSTKIAAFAPVSGAFYQTTMPCEPDSTNIQCVPGREKIPFLEFHGGNDTTIDYFGGERKDACLPAIPYFIQSWATRNGMSTTYSSSLTALDTVVYTYGSGADTGMVTHVFDTNIGHDWPSTFANSDNLEDGHHIASFNASTVIMDFFEKHSLPDGTAVQQPVVVQGNPIVVNGLLRGSH